MVMDDGQDSGAKTRIFGHQQGVKTVREVIECAAELGLKYLTLYAFQPKTGKTR